MAKFLCACFVSFVEPTFFRWIWFLREYFLKGYLDNLCRVICVWIVIMHFLTSGGWQEVKCVYCKVPVGFRSYMRLYPGKLCIWNLWSDDSYLPESGKRPWERVCGKKVILYSTDTSEMRNCLDAFGIEVTVQSSCEKRFEKKKTLQKTLKFPDCRQSIEKQIRPWRSCRKIFRLRFVFVWFCESNEI